MLNLGYWIRLTLTFINRFKLLFLAGIVFGVFSFLALAIIFPHLNKSVQEIGVVGEYTPAEIPDSILSLIGTGLTKIDTSGRAIAGIAESWEASDSGKIWTFHLNKNIKWQDGSKVISKDIKYSFTDATLIYPDDFTLVFRLNTAFAPFPVNLARPIFKTGLLGVGDWKVAGLTLAGTFTDTLTLKDRNNNVKIFKFYPTEDRAKLAFELGEVGTVQNLTDSTPFATWNTAILSPTVDKQKYTAVFFNTSDVILGDKDMRQALSYAIDKSSYGANRALSPISPNSWAYDPAVKPYDFDSDHAKELIQASKIPPDMRKDIKIKLTTLPDLLPVAEKIIHDWKAVGVDATLQITSFVPDDYQALLWVYSIPNDPDQYVLWHSTQVVTNLSRYKSPRVDKLLEDGRLQTDETKRKGIYFDFQKFLLEDAPAAFLYYPTYYSVSKK